MQTQPQANPAPDLSPQLHFQLAHTLASLLPPPLGASPEALHVRDLAAVAKVAALQPVGANELDLAAQCVAARGQAEDVLRLIRRAGDMNLVIRLNAQYASMLRASVSIQGCLMRVQAARHKRAGLDGAASEDAGAGRAAERSLLRVVHQRPAPQEAAPPEAAPATPPELDGPDLLAAIQAASGGPAHTTWLAAALAAPTKAELAAQAEAELAAQAEAEQATAPEAAQATASEAAPATLPEAAPATATEAAPAAHAAQATDRNVPENATKSHTVAFETWMSAQLEALAVGQPEGGHLHKAVREALASGARPTANCR